MSLISSFIPMIFALISPKANFVVVCEPKMAPEAPRQLIRAG